MIRTGIVIGEKSGNIDIQNENDEFGSRIIGNTIETARINGAAAGKAKDCASSCEFVIAPMKA